MRSGIAAGHPATAEAGAEILAEGGNAADAAVAATLASCVAETVMTGLLGGGHGIYFDAETGTARNLDCFVAVPGRTPSTRAVATRFSSGRRVLSPVATQNSTDRSMPARDLAETARGVFGDDRVIVLPDLAEAIDRAATLAEAGEAFGEALGSGGVLVTGSVVTVGEARTMLKGRQK